MRRSPVVILDGAHNPDAARALRETVEELWPSQRRHLLIGMSADKDLAGVCRIVAPLASWVVCTKSPHPRAAELIDVVEAVRAAQPNVTVVTDPRDALTYVLNTAREDDVIIVTGSLFVVGALRSFATDVVAGGAGCPS